MRTKGDLEDVKCLVLAPIDSHCGDWLSRTYGVSIFIDYCTAPATQRKVEEE